MNGLTMLIVVAVVSLAAAWVINSFMGMISGEKLESPFRDWWDIFSNVGRSPMNYAEPLPDVLRPGKFTVGSRIRLLPLPLGAERTMSKERCELFRRCTGKVFRVDGTDAFGALEIHVLNDGSQSPERYDHILYVDPEFAEPASQNEIQNIL